MLHALLIRIEVGIELLRESMLPGICFAHRPIDPRQHKIFIALLMLKL